MARKPEFFYFASMFHPSLTPDTCIVTRFEWAVPMLRKEVGNRRLCFIAPVDMCLFLLMNSLLGRKGTWGKNRVLDGMTMNEFSTLLTIGSARRPNGFDFGEAEALLRLIRENGDPDQNMRSAGLSIVAYRFQIPAAQEVH